MQQAHKLRANFLLFVAARAREAISWQRRRKRAPARAPHPFCLSRRRASSSQATRSGCCRLRSREFARRHTRRRGTQTVGRRFLAAPASLAIVISSRAAAQRCQPAAAAARAPPPLQRRRAALRKLANESREEPAGSIWLGRAAIAATLMQSGRLLARATSREGGRAARGFVVAAAAAGCYNLRRGSSGRAGNAANACPAPPRS